MLLSSALFPFIYAVPNHLTSFVYISLAFYVFLSSLPHSLRHLVTTMSRRHKPYFLRPSRSTPQLSDFVPTPSLSRRIPLPPSPPATETLQVDLDEMATQTVNYMNILSEHAAAIRRSPGSEGAYQRIIEQGHVAPPETEWPSLDSEGQLNFRHQMEVIIQRPATSAEEYVFTHLLKHVTLPMMIPQPP